MAPVSPRIDDLGGPVNPWTGQDPAATGQPGTIFTIKTGRFALQFTGTMLASVTSYDGTVEKRENHCDVDLWKTAEGHYVVRRVRTRRGAVSEDTVVRFLTQQQVVAWLGLGPMSLDVYQDAGWTV